jgi:hypothetical protein
MAGFLNQAARCEASAGWKVKSMENQGIIMPYCLKQINAMEQKRRRRKMVDLREYVARRRAERAEKRIAAEERDWEDDMEGDER